MEGNVGAVRMGIMSRAKILDRIKEGLHGRSGDLELAPSVAKKPSRAAGGGGKLRANNNPEKKNQSLTDLFIEEAGKVNGVSWVANDEGQLREYLSNIAAGHDSKSFIAWETSLIKKLKVTEHLTSNGLRIIKSQDKKQIERADIGISEVDYAIADSGTLVLFSNPNKPRLVSLITPIHVAILDLKKIVRNIFDLFQILSYTSGDESHSKGRVSCITFVTGPSRTADIELNLTLGVHGPKELHILIYKS